MNEEEILNKIGLKLKQIRKSRGYTSYENFAFENELHPAYYWKVEKGKNITLVYLKKILDIHNITFKEFFDDID
jgi:transcriptional regulator with XRE-family HTH domain